MTFIFGGGTTGASQQSVEAQLTANAATQKFIEERTAEARADVQRLFPQAQQVATEGFQGALDVIGGGIPQQLAAFQQGNVGAQQVTAQTLPQIQNAILGLPVNQAAFAPQEITTDLSFLQNLTVPTIQPQVPPPNPPVNGIPGGGFGGIPVGGFGGGFGGIPNLNFSGIPGVDSSGIPGVDSSGISGVDFGDFEAFFSQNF